MNEIYSLKDLERMTKKDMDLIEKIEGNIHDPRRAYYFLQKGIERGIISGAYYNDVIERING